MTKPQIEKPAQDESLFLIIAKLAEKDGASPINKFDGCWEREIGDLWWIAVNGHQKPIKCSRGPDVEPFTCYVEFNGWPAGVFSPFNGIIAAGSEANEETFVSAIEQELTND